METHKQRESVWTIMDGDSRAGTLIANDKIRKGIEPDCWKQIANIGKIPGVCDVTINPDTHKGYGVPIGSVISSEDMLYMGCVGYDIKCSMSYLMTDLPSSEVKALKEGRAIMDAMMARVSIGKGIPGKLFSKKDSDKLLDFVEHGFSEETCIVDDLLAASKEWIPFCEDASHNNGEIIKNRIDYHTQSEHGAEFLKSLNGFGSLGSGNHFSEVGACAVREGKMELAEKWGLKDGCLGVLTHCGSRKLGHMLASIWFNGMKAHFNRWKIPFPGNDRELVYAPVRSEQGQTYLADLAIAGNFATVNHMLINQLYVQALTELYPGIKCRMVYMISHNFVRREYDGKTSRYVHRKGATRAHPAGHHSLRGTPFESTGHPILLPGHALSGSSIMVAKSGASVSQYSINHGAGRVLGRKDADRKLDQGTVDQEFRDAQVITNHRKFPKDEAKDAYKDYDQVMDSVTSAGLAEEVARLDARFLIK